MKCIKQHKLYFIYVNWWVWQKENNQFNRMKRRRKITQSVDIQSPLNIIKKKRIEEKKLEEKGRNGKKRKDTG